MLLPKFLSRKISPEKSLDFLSHKSVVRPASALNFSQFVGFQDSPNLSKIEKVAENRDFDGKETLIVKRAIAISKRVLG